MEFIKEQKFLTTATLVAFIGVFIKYYLGNQNNQNSLSKFNDITIKSIIIYPVKSCKGIELKSCKLTKYGFENDRRWMIIKDNRYVSMKPYPIMSTIIPTFSDDGKKLILSKEGMEDLVLSAEPLDINKMDPSRIYQQVNLIDNVAQVYDEGDEASNCSNVSSSNLERNIRQHMAENVDPNHLDKFKNSLANSCQIMLLGQGSIDLINERIDKTREEKCEQKQPPLTWRRYRPNLLLSGTSPFQEDDWKLFKSNKSDVTFNVCDYNGRCPIVLVNEKSVMDPYSDDEPLRTLRSFRAATCKAGDKTLVGIYCAIEDRYIDKIVSVGETITVLKGGLTSKYFNKLFK
ncbi:hypothetical protein DICPUDRAFT_90079 [Dictyostelium purpureum]|uniref:MOSC domain-containing protein n=1 Tax=Dictyostelium purpureum TaxID=5786 RepID=F1A082_DICPU|nr:uncharacterized protein DICPUDRAFT_90079 [Dictyostelium purpureum]EGC30404.1 hypothetical protein DICPUDRAFT_90079 [Dictyostelium purpureum]|eukprot:XP_003293072.1 hypothetical protein DICPUDRAFT_90079 [Dictyostelium purpureum]